MSSVNIVELMAGGDDADCSFDQPCRFGHRVDGHAVYCHNSNWDDSPRKCRRSWYTDGKIKDEECAGFEPNPEFSGTFFEIQPAIDPCHRCKGKRRIGTDQGKTETCPSCMGSGENQTAISLSDYEQNTLELGSVHSRRCDTAGHAFVRIAENKEQKDSVHRLCDLGLVVVRSMTPAERLMVYLLENTMKGEAVMRANWAKSETEADVATDPWEEQG